MKKNVLLLGGSGMLGSMILDVFSQDATVNLHATVRNKKHLPPLKKKFPSVKFYVFDAEKDSLASLFKQTKKNDWILNAIGKIKPFIHEDNREEIEHAIAVNATFPFSIQREIARNSTKVIQIATDCVYSGKKGKYVEVDVHDALDVYGKTKSLGEVNSDAFLHLRVSVIGPENGTRNSLLAWFVHQEKLAKLSGFTNHVWNGITTLHFARICLGIIKNDAKLPVLTHIVPGNTLNKSELLKIFSEVFDRKDVSITSKKAKERINRTLQTVHGTINRKLWKNAGYAKPPRIKEMVKELAEYMKERKI